MILADRKFERRTWVDLGIDEIPTLLDELLKRLNFERSSSLAFVSAYLQELWV